MRPGLARGLLFGVPVSLALWAAILVPLILSPAWATILIIEASLVAGGILGAALVVFPRRPPLPPD